MVNVQTAFTDDNVWLPLTYQSNILIISERLSGAVASFPSTIRGPLQWRRGVTMEENGRLDYPEFLRRLPKAELHIHLEARCARRRR